MKKYLHLFSRRDTLPDTASESLTRTLLCLTLGTSVMIGLALVGIIIRMTLA